MKRLLSALTIATIIAIPAIGQEEKLQKLETLENKSSAETKKKTRTTVETETNKDLNNDRTVKDTVIVEVGDEIFSVREMGDETRIKIGKRQFRVVEDKDGVVVFRSSDSDRSDSDRSDSDSRRGRHSRFNGHLGGLEFGFNSYLSDFWSTSLPPEEYYMDLNTTKSNNWNFILPCINLGMSRHFGIAASLGLAFNKYRFDGNNSIVKGETGIIGPFYPDPNISYSKTKLATTYAILPILLEGQIPVNGSNTINIGAGVIGAVKLGSHTKVVYNTNGKQKEKLKDDYSLNTLRWGATGRIGYEFFQVYGTCYFTSLFEGGKGPELYPFEVGIAFTFND